VDVGYSTSGFSLKSSVDVQIDASVTLLSVKKTLSVKIDKSGLHIASSGSFLGLAEASYTIDASYASIASASFSVSGSFKTDLFTKIRDKVKAIVTDWSKSAGVFGDAFANIMKYVADLVLNTVEITEVSFSEGIAAASGGKFSATVKARFFGDTDVSFSVKLDLNDLFSAAKEVANWLKDYFSKLSYDRGAGSYPVCYSDQDYEFAGFGGLCYPKCSSGYYGLATVCWQSCTSGYTDIGAACTGSASDCYKKWPWKDCDSGYKSVVLGCCKYYFKSTYDRGVGKSAQICSGNLENDAGLCYPRCKSGYVGRATVCWISGSK